LRRRFSAWQRFLKRNLGRGYSPFAIIQSKQFGRENIKGGFDGVRSRIIHARKENKHNMEGVSIFISSERMVKKRKKKTTANQGTQSVT